MNVRALGLTVMTATILLAPAVVSAQVGIGPRISFVRGTEGGDDESQRFFGGTLRMGSGKVALELALDYRSEETEDELARVTEYPFQASMLFFPVRARFAPYLLGGVGWYSQKIEHLVGAGPLDVEVTSRRFGYHAGFGAEARLHRRFALYGDYRYTFLDFGDDDDDDDDEPSRPGLIPFAGQLGLSNEGSMFTWGAIFYF